MFLLYFFLRQTSSFWYRRIASSGILKAEALFGFLSITGNCVQARQRQKQSKFGLTILYIFFYLAYQGDLIAPPPHNYTRGGRNERFFASCFFLELGRITCMTLAEKNVALTFFKKYETCDKRFPKHTRRQKNIQAVFL